MEFENDAADVIEKLQLSEGFEVIEKSLSVCIQGLVASALVPSLKREEDFPYKQEDFYNTAVVAERKLKIIRRLLEELCARLDKRGINISTNFLKTSTIDCLILATQYHDGSTEWSSSEAANEAAELIQTLCQLCGCDSALELLIGSGALAGDCQEDCLQVKEQKSLKACKVRFEDGLAKQLLQELSRLFTKETWKNEPALKTSYWWILFELKSPHLGDHVAYLLPPALFILDDWELRHKVFALRCIMHIVHNTAGSELRWYGRADVIYNAVHHQLYSREAELLQESYPAAILIAKVLDSDPAMARIIAATKLDHVLEMLLREMCYEQRLDLRRVFAQQLTPILRQLGVFAVRWSKDIVEVSTNYLSTHEGSRAEDRLCILQALQVFVQTCWPQLHHHMQPLLVSLVRLVYDITLPDSRVEAEAQGRLLDHCMTLFTLIASVEPKMVQRLCAGLEAANVHEAAKPTVLAFARIAHDADTNNLPAT